MTSVSAAEQWVARGFLLVPVPYQAKKPNLPAWQKLRLTQANISQYFNGKKQNFGLLLGSPHADVDLDCMEAVAAAPILLPATNMIFGRESKPASHWIYQAAPPLGSLKFVDPVDGATLAELRCLKKDGSIGMQTVAPPSTHPSGELIRFEPGGDGDGMR
jgi:hypothetical protein